MKSAVPTVTVNPLFFFLAKAFHGVLRRVTHNHKEISLFRSIVTMIMEMNVSFSASAVKIKA
jgi:hypothetical protein